MSLSGPLMSPVCTGCRRQAPASHLTRHVSHREQSLVRKAHWRRVRRHAEVAYPIEEWPPVVSHLTTCSSIVLHLEVYARFNEQVANNCISGFLTMDIFL